MSSKPNIAIIIPAAGASRRLGSPKQLLKWKNSTLLSHAVETAMELGQREIIVVLGAHYDKIKPELDNRPVRILNNIVWKNGLGSSIALGVEYLINSDIDYDAVLIMLADQPLITPLYLRAMLEKFRVDENSIIAAAYENRKHGVPALFDKKYFTNLRRLSDDRGAQKFIKELDKFVTSVDINSRKADIDTKEDYNKIYKANHQ